MKKTIFLSALLVGMGLTGIALASCSDDDNNSQVNPNTANAADIDYTESNAESWGNYMRVVANLLRNDANTLYTSWNQSYNGGQAFAHTFMNHNTSDYPTALSCVQQIVDGCVDIASEVGQTKIGEPYDYYMAGNYTQALYAVESWYSFHSREDYRNNIYSIRNSYYGTLDGTVSELSLSALVKASNPALDQQIVDAINGAASAIWAIPNPFRNNIGSDQVPVAMSACTTLENIFDTSLRQFVAMQSEADLQPIVEQYVQQIVLPTYKDLSEKNEALYTAVRTFADNPSDELFSAACEAWLAAREPWEKSEAFLFGPVDALGLDPNMDSWPLDQDAIVNILNSGNFNGLEWSDDDTDDEIAAAQNVRGFHTLEFLLFKNGEPRHIN